MDYIIQVFKKHCESGHMYKKNVNISSYSYIIKKYLHAYPPKDKLNITISQKLLHYIPLQDLIPLNSLQK